MADEPVTTQHQAPDVDAVIAKVKEHGQQQTQQTQGQEPQLPEDFNPEQFNQTLQKVVGVESYEQIKTLQEKAQQAEQIQQQMLEIQQRNKELEAKVQMNPYANEFVQQVDQFFRQNRTEDEIRKFFDLHTKDVKSMSHSDAIVQKMMMENPGMDEGDVRLLVESQYEPQMSLAEDATDADKARYAREKKRLDAQMKLEGEQARKWLQDQMKSFNSPEMEQKRQQQQQQMQQLTERWSKVSNVLVDPKAFDDGIKLDFEYKDDKGGWNYSHPGYAPKITPEIQEQLSGLITQYAIQNNIPLSEEYIPQLMEYRDAVLRNYFFDDFMKSILIDFHAEVAEQFAKRYSGVGGQQHQRSATPQRDTAPPKDKSKGKPTPPKPGDMFF